MNYADTIPGFSDTDRLGLTAFGSVLLHVVVVLGIGFTAPKILPKTNDLPTLDITLINTRSDTAPEKADFLAQANQEGGGLTDKARIARSPLPAQPSPTKSKQLPRVQLAADLDVSAPRVPPQALTRDRSDRRVALQKPQPDAVKKLQDRNKLGVAKSNLEQERQRLSAEISREWQEYLKRPKRKFLSARTREYRYASYMQAWVLKVERIGNLHYPKEAKQTRLRGNVVLDTQITPQGKVLSVDVKTSSGHKLLDDAAVRSVRLAAPFAPFPPDIRKEVDILHITRTWQYRGSQLVSRRPACFRVILDAGEDFVRRGTAARRHLSAPAQSLIL